MLVEVSSYLTFVLFTSLLLRASYQSRLTAGLLIGGLLRWQCVRTYVRAFPSHHAMDCCKHDRLDLRSEARKKTKNTPSLFRLGSVEVAQTRTKLRQPDRDFHIEPDIYPCQCV